MKVFPHKNILKSTIFLCLLVNHFVWSEVKVANVVVQPRWPWNGLVDITYSIECKEKDEEGNLKDVYVDFMAVDGDRNQTVPMKTLRGPGANEPVKDGGPYTVTWDAAKDAPTLNSVNFKIRIHAIAGIAPYLVVYLDKLDNPTAKKYEYKSQPPDLSNDTCRTTELWLRQIQPGTFTMGSPSNEVGRVSGLDMAQHEVTLTKLYYIGVFECTQKQWHLVMGNNPSSYKGDCRPVESVSYNIIRGTSSEGGAGWPKYGHTVDATSFMGRLREKTGLTFDLPTDAQWEYACRAGTTTALNSGKNLESTYSDINVSELGRYNYNNNDGKGGYSQHTKVGSYLPNAWGLYDMYGNVWEWCLDWWGSSTTSTESMVDPVGPLTAPSDYKHVMRGSWWGSYASGCRSALRYYDFQYAGNYSMGFRIVCLPFE